MGKIKQMLSIIIIVALIMQNNIFLFANGNLNLLVEREEKVYFNNNTSSLDDCAKGIKNEENIIKVEESDELSKANDNVILKSADSREWTEIGDYLIPLKLSKDTKIVPYRGENQKSIVADDGTEINVDNIDVLCGFDDDEMSYTIFFDTGKYTDEYIEPIIVKRGEDVTFPKLKNNIEGVEFLYWICTDSEIDGKVYKVNAGETIIAPDYRTNNYFKDDGTIIFNAVYKVWNINIDYKLDPNLMNKLVNCICDKDYMKEFVTDEKYFIDWYNSNSSVPIDSIDDITKEGAKKTIESYLNNYIDRDVRFSDDIWKHSDLLIPGFAFTGFSINGHFVDDCVGDVESLKSFMLSYGINVDYKDEMTLEVQYNFEVGEKSQNKKKSSIYSGGSGGSGGSSGGDGSQYSTQMKTVDEKTIESLGPGALKYANQNINGSFEFDVNANQFRYFVLDADNNKNYVVNNWAIENINGQKVYYLMDENGFMVSGLVLCDDKLYYFSEDPIEKGKMMTGFVKIGNEIYYFDSDGYYADDINRMPMNYKIINSGANTVAFSNTETLVSGFNGTEEEKITFAGADSDTYKIVYDDVIISTFSFPKSTCAVISYESKMDLKDKHRVWSGTWAYNKSHNVTYQFYNGDVVEPELFEEIGGVLTLSPIFPYETHTVTYLDQNDIPCKIDQIMYNHSYTFKQYDYITKIDNSILEFNYENLRAPDYQCVGYHIKDDSGRDIPMKAGEQITIKSDVIVYTDWDYIKGGNAKYISDIAVGYGFSGMLQLAINKYMPMSVNFFHNATKVNYEKDNRYVYVGYKTTDNPKEAIRGLAAIFLDNEANFSTYQFNGAKYELAKYCSGSRYKRDRNAYEDISGYNADFNRGDYKKNRPFIYLLYSKDKNAGEPIKSITAASGDGKSSAESVRNRVVAGGTSYEFNKLVNDTSGNPLDFNRGVEGDWVYMGYRQVKPLRYQKIKAPKERKGNNWMAYVDGNTRLNRINMPGTHDSGSFSIRANVPIVGKLKKICGTTQKLNIREQLNAGVRHFDIRLGAYDNQELMVFHGGCDPTKSIGAAFKNAFTECTCTIGDGKTPLYLRDVLIPMYQFLNDNPSETIIMDSKYETRSETVFKEQMISIIDQFARERVMYVANKVPLLKDVRGKIIIIDHDYSNPRRSYSKSVVTSAITDRGWRPYYADSEGGPVTVGDITFSLENHYEYEMGRKDAVSKKIEYIKKLLDAQYNQNTGAVIYTSGYVKDINFPIVSHLPDIEALAGGVNIFLDSYAFQKGKIYGWICGDFMEAGRARKIFETNNFVDLRSKEYIDN